MYLNVILLNVRTVSVILLSKPVRFSTHTVLYTCTRTTGLGGYSELQG